MGARVFIQRAKDAEFSQRCRLQLLTRGLCLKQKRRPVHNRNSHTVHMQYVCLLCILFKRKLNQQ